MAIRSPYPDVFIPDDVSVPEYVFSYGAKFGDRVALEDGVTGEKITYRELIDLSHRVAGHLHASGVKKGEVICMFAPNQPRWLVAMFGINLAGAIPTTINPIYTADELNHQLADSGAKKILTIPALLPVVRATGVAFKAIYVFGEASGCIPFSDLLKPNPPRMPKIPISPKRDISLLPYSSGTTSRPKGVMLSHYNVVANLCQMRCPNITDFTERDTLVVVLPLFHIYGLVPVSLLGLCYGVRLLLFPRFEPVGWLEGLQKHRVTIAHVAPPLVQFLAKDPRVDKYDLSSLRTVISAAAPLGIELSQTLVTRLGVTLRQGYGMTEMAPISNFMPFESQHKYNSIGRVVPNITLKILDPETGKPVGKGERGEFCFKGPNNMLGYLANPTATAATIDKDGYLHTGDIGFMDDDGDCYIVDRCKELIKVRGFQVAPAELEDLLLGHPSVLDVAVVGQTVGVDERPLAFIVLRPGVQQNAKTEADIMKFVADRVAAYKRLGAVSFISVIPKSASGKILRRELRANLAKL